MSEKIIEIDESQITDVNFYQKKWSHFNFEIQKSTIINFVNPDFEIGLNRFISEISQFSKTVDLFQNELLFDQIKSSYSVAELHQVYQTFLEIFDQQVIVKDLTEIFNPNSEFWIWAIVNLATIRPIIINQLGLRIEHQSVEKLTVLNFWDNIKKQAVLKNIKKEK